MATILTQTTLAAAVDDKSNTIRVASITDILNVGGGVTQTNLMINNEMMIVTKQPTSTTPTGPGQVEVVRGTNGTRANGHVSGATVLVGRPRMFFFVDPSGAVVATDVDYLPRINVPTSNQWLAFLDRWIPGFGNPGNSGTPVPYGMSTAVASAAGFLTPTGPIFHVTGVAAITGITAPEGFNGGVFAVIPDGIFTWTTANNIAVAGTSVVGKVIFFTFDPVTNKWYPSAIS